jgi:hypothetical protein
MLDESHAIGVDSVDVEKAAQGIARNCEVVVKSGSENPENSRSIST